MVFVQFNETDVHVNETEGFAKVCLNVKDMKEELLRSIVVYSFSEDGGAIGEPYSNQYCSFTVDVMCTR